MASGKAALAKWLGPLLFKTGQVREIEAISPIFRRISLEGQSLLGSRWSFGDKVQVLVSGGDMRTYTPINWDEERGRTSFVLYLQGDAPGARWAKSLTLADSVQFFGPRKSLKLAETSGPQILFGDETSFGVAAALWTLRQGHEVELVFEVSQEAESRAALAALGLQATLVERTPNDAHLAEITSVLQKAQLAGAFPIFTGRAQAIQQVQRNLGRTFRGPSKAYWSLGKRGLD